GEIIDNLPELGASGLGAGILHFRHDVAPFLPGMRLPGEDLESVTAAADASHRLAPRAGRQRVGGARGSDSQQARQSCLETYQIANSLNSIAASRSPDLDFPTPWGHCDYCKRYNSACRIGISSSKLFPPARASFAWPPVGCLAPF